MKMTPKQIAWREQQRADGVGAMVEQMDAIADALRPWARSVNTVGHADGHVEINIFCLDMSDLQVWCGPNAWGASYRGRDLAHQGRAPSAQDVMRLVRGDDPMPRVARASVSSSPRQLSLFGGAL